MNVGDLKQILESLDDDLTVVLSKDAEGNSFSPLAEFSAGVYEPENSYSGEFDCDEIDPDAICLWPTN